MFSQKKISNFLKISPRNNSIFKGFVQYIFFFCAGTNDKAGGQHYMLRWANAQAIKETFVPLTEVGYPYMKT